MKISRRGDLSANGNLGMTLAEAKQLLAVVQPEVSAAQAREHVTRRPVWCSTRRFSNALTAFFSPEVAASHVNSIAERCETLRHSCANLARSRTLVMNSKAAHKLAGCAGMFGFGRVATLGRRFEQAIQSGSADAPILANGLGAALEETLQAIHDRMPITAG